MFTFVELEYVIVAFRVADQEGPVCIPLGALLVPLLTLGVCGCASICWRSTPTSGWDSTAANGQSSRWLLLFNTTFWVSTVGVCTRVCFLYVCGATWFYQHTFTEQQEHARARFKTAYIPRVDVTSHLSTSYCSVDF